jgi:lysyl-tRNA synthetase class 2
MSDSIVWRPSASQEMLRERARLYAAIRTFFAQREVLEVDVPLLNRGTVPDLNIDSISVRLSAAQDQRYLQTSPELFHKRLLAADSGAIYQLGHVFRDEPSGRYHQPEFVLLEWYQPGFTLEALMDEVVDLLRQVGLDRPVQRVTYQQAFARWVGIEDVLRADTTVLRAAAAVQGIDLVDDLGDDPLPWLQLLQVQVLEPALRDEGAVLITEWPAQQAALARLHPDHPEIALRFELYVDGIELANGYDELRDPIEQRARFADELAQREREGRAVLLDEAFLAALDAGLPACCGVALGVDRLLMALTGAQQIRDVVAFATTD